MNDCIVLYEQTATDALAIRQMSAASCFNNANETCQNNHRIKFQATLALNNTYAAGVQSFTGHIEVKKHVVSFQPITHSFALLGNGAMYYEETGSTITVFDANGVPFPDHRPQ